MHLWTCPGNVSMRSINYVCGDYWSIASDASAARADGLSNVVGPDGCFVRVKLKGMVLVDRWANVLCA